MFSSLNHEIIDGGRPDDGGGGVFHDAGNTMVAGQTAETDGEQHVTIAFRNQHLVPIAQRIEADGGDRRL